MYIEYIIYYIIFVYIIVLIGPGVAVMGKYNKDDGSIQYGVKTVFNPLENDQSVLVELQANGYFITCASVGPNAQYETACRIGNYTTDTLRLQYSQNYYNITSEVRTDGMGIVRINSNNFVVCYGRGIAETGVCVLGRVVNNFGNGVDSQIVYTNEIVFNSEGGTRGVKIKVVNAQVDGTVFFVLCYESRNDGILIVYNIYSLYIWFKDDNIYCVYYIYNILF